VHRAVAALVAFSSPVTAHAECAWVLWREHSTTVPVVNGSVSRGDPISSMASFTDSATCNRAARDEAFRSNARMSRTLTTIKPGLVLRLDGGAWRSVLEAEGLTDVTDFKCTPDTVGPWGTKEK
jgi:hypothetical protein